MAALLVGDRGLTANSVKGIDPLEILNLQVKPNVVFVVDASTDMGKNPEGTHAVGGDDPESRFYQTKQALRELITANDGRANFGIVSTSADPNRLVLNDVNNLRGPLIYVTADATGASWKDKFDNFQSAFANYDGDQCLGQPPLPISPFCSLEIHQSFRTNGIFGGGATPYQGKFYLASRLFRHGVKYTWDSNGGPGGFRRALSAIDTTITCPPPPAGLLGDDTDEFNGSPVNEPRACFQLEDPSNGNAITTYYLTSPVYGDPINPPGVGSGECDGTNSSRCVVAGVPACTAPSNTAALRGGPLRLELPLDATTGLPLGTMPNTPIIATAPVLGTQPNPAGGMQIGGRRPLEAALRAAAAHLATVFATRPAAVVGLQRNFIIVITSGADNTGGNPTALATTLRGATNPPGANDITTLVVTINGENGYPASPDRTSLDALQNAGTLGRRNTAFGAATAEQLKRALNFAFSEAIATGTFSTESSITESIYEYAPLAGAFNPVDPTTRYGARVPILLQSSFDMPGFDGHLRAFVNSANVSTAKWDAGIRLLDRVWNGAGGGGICPGQWTYNPTTPLIGPTAVQIAACQGPTTPPVTLPAVWRTFTQLRGADPVSPKFAPNGDIRRRIFTTRSNGVFPYDTSRFGVTFRPSDRQCPVPLWPPSSATSLGVDCQTLALPVAPADDVTAGLFDNAMGIGGANDQTAFDDLQNDYGSCLNVPASLNTHACNALDGSGNPDYTRRAPRARREARESILAFMAGAQAVKIAGLPQRNLAGDIVYQARNWVLAESSLGVPAVVPPPLEARPLNHTAEYLVFRDGIRNSAGNIAADGATAGFGLRNPDRNANVPVGTANGTGLNGVYEPLMSTVYHAANDMLHAFRGGPCPSNSCSLSSGAIETGGEEMWGFVPYDQLAKLPERMQAQGRVPHTFMLASSVRFNDVFVPGQWTFGGRTFLGTWRTVLVIGRGIAGQHYTTIDITAPGQLTRASTDTLPPFAVWSRGNPDLQDGGITLGQPGTTAGAGNSLLDIDNGDEGANDIASYREMGETWSVPAMAAVPPVEFFGAEFAMFAGSGYSPTQNPNEGKTFYAMDALTGDILFAPRAPDSSKTCATIDPREICPVPNAIVANPAAYVAAQLAPGFVGNPAASTSSLVYVGDLHGRMWKFMNDAPGALVQLQPPAAAAFPPFNTNYTDSPDQPIGSSAALLNIDSVPYVYWETGNDLRVIPPVNFRFVAMADVGNSVAPTTTQTDPLARKFLLPLETTLAGFRGTAQPATAFNATGVGRVFFIGTKFNDQDVASGTCKSGFDSVLFAVGAVTGSAVYDLDSSGSVTTSDRSVLLAGSKVNAIRGSMGQIVLDKGDIGSSAPPAPPAPAPASTANEGSSGEVIMNKIKSGSAVCR
jgi:hypothetical protein